MPLSFKSHKLENDISYYLPSLPLNNLRQRLPQSFFILGRRHNLHAVERNMMLDQESHQLPPVVALLLRSVANSAQTVCGTVRWAWIMLGSWENSKPEI